MYTDWLRTCTEKQLFVFIESSVTTLVEEVDRAPVLWAKEQEEGLIKAMEETTRFGVPRTEPDFQDWYSANLKGWYRVLSHDEHIAALREMPWNARTN